MPNKSAKVAIVIIIALLGLYAFQSYYNPSFSPYSDNFPSLAGGNEGNILHSNAREIAPGVFLERNVSLVEGKRADTVTLYGRNLSSVVGGGLLVFVPKAIAGNASEIVASQQMEVLKEDPVVYFELKSLKPASDLNGFKDEFTFTFYYRYANRERLETRVHDFVLSSDFSPGVLFGSERLLYIANLFDAARGQINALSPEQADEFTIEVQDILNSLASPDSRLSALNAYFESKFNLQAEREVEVLPSELKLSVSEFYPLAKERFTLPYNPQAVGAPEVRVSGLASNYRINPVISLVENSVVDVDIDLNLPESEYRGGLFDFDEITGSIDFYYPMTGYNFSVPLTIQVDHVYDATLITPRALPGGTGSELMFFIPNLLRPIGQVTLKGNGSNCGLNNVTIDIPAADPANPKAVVLYIPQGVKNAIRQHGECNFVDQQGGVVPQAISISSSLTRSSNLEPLMPFVANLNALQPNQRWTGCSERYCSCIAAQQALKSAIDKTIVEAHSFYGGGYARYQNKFWRFYLFNLAQVENCNWGSVPLQGAVSGKVQIVAIGVNPAHTSEVVAKSFHSPDNFQPVSAVQGVTGGEIKQAVSGQWLCFNPNGLPQSMPEGTCSAEQRRG